MGRGATKEEILLPTRASEEGFRLVPPIPSPTVGIRAQHGESDSLVSETIQDQQWGSRDDGFFGSGAYFVSTPERVEYMTRQEKGRELVGLDLSGKNLFKPSSEKEAFELHDWLGHLNYEMISDERSGDPYDRLSRALGKASKAISRSKRIDSLITNMPVDFPVTKEMIAEVIKGARKDLAEGNLDSDSVSTRLMKALGYDGIDTRHLDLLDNTRYGSVLYR